MKIEDLSYKLFVAMKANNLEWLQSLLKRFDAPSAVTANNCGVVRAACRDNRMECVMAFLPYCSTNMGFVLSECLLRGDTEGFALFDAIVQYNPAFVQQRHNTLEILGSKYCDALASNSRETPRFLEALNKLLDCTPDSVVQHMMNAVHKKEVFETVEHVLAQRQRHRLEQEIGAATVVRSKKI